MRDRMHKWKENFTLKMKMPYWIQVLKWINGGMKKKKKDMYFSDDVVSGQVIFLSDVLNMS